MRIYQLPAFLDFIETFDKSGVIYARLSDADVVIYSDHLGFLEYGRWPWKRRRIVLDNREFKVEREDEADIILLSSYEKGDCYLVDSEGVKLSYKPEIISLITHVAFNKNRDNCWRGAKIIGRIYPSRRESIFTLADLEGNNLVLLEGVRAKCTLLLDDCILFFNNDDSYIYCTDHKFQTIWKYRPDVNFAKNNVREPIVIGDLVIISFGPSRTKKYPGPIYKGKQFADQAVSFDSNLYALNLNVGNICWHTIIPKTIDNMTIINDKLYISSTNEIFVINPVTGNIEKRVETKLNGKVDLNIEPSSLHIQGNMLFFCHQVDACILVYDLNDLHLIKHIDIPAPYTIKEFEYYNEITGKLYFKLGPRFPREYYHTSPILEVDPTDLNSEIDILRGPPVDVDLRPSENNSDEREVWVTIHDVPLDEAMVYAEMHTQDQAYYHGTHGMFGAYNKTDDFNGIVHFRYNGSDKPTQEVNDKLRLLEKNFSNWARNTAFASTDPSKNAILEAQYID